MSINTNKVMRTFKEVFDSNKNLIEARLISMASSHKMDHALVEKMVNVIRSTSEESFSNGTRFLEAALKEDAKKKK